MEVVLRYRGRTVSESEVAEVRALIAAHPSASRRELSRRVCAAWNWVQPNGAPRDMVCRGLMLELERGGHVDLPPVRMRPPNPLANRPRPARPEVDASPVVCGLRDLGPLEFRRVRRTPDEPLFNGLIEHHHYLGYTQPVGEHLKYMVWAGGRPIACLAWSSAPRHLGPRDRFIGWSREARRRNIRLLAYNSRYLILPWVEVPCLASHILGQMARRVPSDWEQLYGHRVCYLETFVDPGRWRGTCYRAANWIVLGLTTGRGKASNSHRPNRPLKQVLGLPIDRRFRQMLGRCEHRQDQRHPDADPGRGAARERPLQLPGRAGDDRVARHDHHLDDRPVEPGQLQLQHPAVAGSPTRPRRQGARLGEK